jgi:hypothetical protein
VREASIVELLGEWAGSFYAPNREERVRRRWKKDLSDKSF